jgi:GDSL-like lipase/acylhydrolase family protein
MNSPAAQRLPQRSRWRERLGRAGLVLTSVVLVLVVLELGLRAASGWAWLADWHNLVLGARTVHNANEQSRFMHDALVGYVPRPDGFRPTEEAPGVPILAVGDSYTYGEEVSDNESWPAHLQELADHRVLNAGVSGYGFDQAVLRAEQLSAARRPSAIVVEFIADDIRRTEMRRQWGAEKPYFDFEGNGLVLRNVPVPPRPNPGTTLTFWQRLLGRSFLFDFVLRRLDLLHDWFGDHVRVHRWGDGERISCLLTERLRELQASTGAKVIVLAEYDPMVWQKQDFAAEQRRLVRGLLGCARQRGLGTIDSYEALAMAPGGPLGLYGQWHMNDKGNRLIAGLVANALAQGAAH